MQNRLADVVHRLRAPRVFVIGDLILDRYVWGEVSRISPEAPVQILDAAREEFRPGGAANVAHNAAALGASALCGGVVGRDKEGDQFLRLLARLDVSTRGVIRDPSRPTAIKTRLIAHNQQMLRIDHERRHALDASKERALMASIDRAATRCDVALVSDYNKGAMTGRISRRVISTFNRRGKPVLVGLKSRDVGKYGRATGASLNRTELALVSGKDELETGARALVARLGLKFLVVTLGEKGMHVYGPNGCEVRLSAVARQVYDVTGAGDTVLAAFAIGYASGLGLEDCALLANAAAGIVVGKVGTAVATRQELLDRAAEETTGAHRKILSDRGLAQALESERRRGRKIVFTNGCFDLLHVGHLGLLEYARSKGNVLVVGVNSDRSVRRLKGPLRPILPERERMRLLAALECVDYVTRFDEDTPERLIRRVRPDVLVKGEDYAGKNVVGRKVVTSYGGRVELAPLVKGVSTTDIVSRIRRDR
ncbi:MAG: D-glycero-beta-D-manno-heptose 1-phosphate adenylyltransferase [Planctomycetes bacterium]|nr:D-glycero-beta-D-manno-heptose 1-phosphate adenylyltransferase [Planctomycetota bacterium]